MRVNVSPLAILAHTASTFNRSASVGVLLLRAMRLTVAHRAGHFNRFFTGLRKRQKNAPFSGVRYGHPVGRLPQRLAYAMALRLRFW